MHLEAEQIERLIGGELPEHERRALDDHAERCATCASVVEAARREEVEIGRLLSSLDHPVPRVDPVGLARRARRRTLSPRLAAAAIALLVFTGAAAAVPGSPLRSWLSDVLSGGDAGPPDAEPAAQSERPPAGISVVPTPRFEVAFESAQESGLIRIRIDEQAEVVVRSDGEGVGYSVEPQGVRVLNVGSRANHEIVLPRDAEGIIIRVGDEVVYEMREGRIVVPSSGAVTGSYIVDLTTLRPEGA